MYIWIYVYMDIELRVSMKIGIVIQRRKLETNGKVSLTQRKIKSNQEHIYTPNPNIS